MMRASLLAIFVGLVDGMSVEAFAPCRYSSQAQNSGGTFAPHRSRSRHPTESDLPSPALGVAAERGNRSPAFTFSTAAPANRRKSQEESGGARPCVVRRLDLSDRFERWRFLQRLLEAEVDADDANELLYRVLKSFLDFPRPERVPDETYPGGTRENPSPRVTPESRAIMEAIFRVEGETGLGTVPALRHPDCAPFKGGALDGIERLLPDPTEEEDAHRSGWDLVIELIGREAVKMAEQSGDDGWRARCSIVRLLIHYDFLNDGVVEDPFE